MMMVMMIIYYISKDNDKVGYLLLFYFFFFKSVPVDKQSNIHYRKIKCSQLVRHGAVGDYSYVHLCINRVFKSASLLTESQFKKWARGGGWWVVGGVYCDSLAMT